MKNRERERETDGLRKGDKKDRDTERKKDRHKTKRMRYIP